MSLLLHSPLPCTWWKLEQQVRLNPLSSSSRARRLGGFSRSMSSNANNNNNSSSHGNGVIECFFNPTQDPIIREALKEPVAFFGGMFAGILRLDLNDEPLKEWVTRTVEAAGISEDETAAEGSATEAAPQEIEIE